MSAPTDPPLDAREFGGLLDRLDAALDRFDASGETLTRAVRTADAAAFVDAETGHRVAADALRAVAADRAAFLTAHGSPSLSRLAADSRLTHLVSRCGSLAGRLSETRTAARGRSLALARGAAACGAVRDLLARGGRRAAGYAVTGTPAGGGGALLDAAA